MEKHIQDCLPFKTFNESNFALQTAILWLAGWLVEHTLDSIL